MKNAIIVHGVNDSRKEFMDQKYWPEKGWKDWLSFELQHRDILPQQPQMPHRYVDMMKYDEWAHVFKKFEITPDTILIGHSAGGGFLLRYLSENQDIKIKQLILVAPWIDTERWAGDFYKFELDKNLATRINRMDIFYSTDDDDYILKSVFKIIETYPGMNIHKFEDKEHFNGPQYPEILDAVIKE